MNTGHISVCIIECKSVEEFLTLNKILPQFKCALRPESDMRKRVLV
jgi:hypothetical protein